MIGTQPAFRIVSSDLTFSPAAESRTAVFESPSAITASCDQGWLSVSVSGKTLTATSTVNETNGARYATITLESAGEKMSLSAFQYNPSLSVADFTDTEVSKFGATLSFGWSGNLPPSDVRTSEPWLVAELTDKAIEVTVLPNDEEVRRGTVSYDFLGKTYSANITQQASPNPYGAYTLNGANASGAAVVRPLQLTKVSDTEVFIAMTGPNDTNANVQSAGLSMGGTFPIQKVDDATYVITWAGGTSLAEDFYTGSNAYCKIYTCLFRNASSTAATYRSYDSSVSCEFVLEYDEASGKFKGALRNNGSWGSYNATGIGWLYYYQATSGSWTYGNWFTCPKFTDLQQN